MYDGYVWLSISLVHHTLIPDEKTKSWFYRDGNECVGDLFVCLPSYFYSMSL